MFYLFIGLTITCFLYYIENRKITFKGKLISLPLLFSLPIFLYFIGPAFQYNVGTDYFSYIWIYETPNRVEDIYLNLHHEYGFYFIIKTLQYFNFHSQSIFIVFGFLDTVLFFTILIMLRKYGFKPWIVFLLFFTVTTTYHNQMNGLRQYIAILSTPILFILIYEKKYFKSILISLFALSFHKSFIIIIILIPFIIIMKRLSNLQLFKLSLIIPFFLIVITPIIGDIFIEYIFPIYKTYLNEQEFKFTSILTKLYYLVFVGYFWYVYLIKQFVSKVNQQVFKFMILIFSMTYCIYLTGITFPMYGRIFQYFFFFYIFPLYYIIEYNIIHRNYRALTILVSMLVIPYIMKILVFPVREYSYNCILFQ